MYKLIIVDDEPKICEGIAVLFPWKQIGFEVVKVCYDGLSALEYIRENPVDAILCDIEMPNLNGLELCAALEEKDICTVLFSSYQKYEYFRQAIQYHVKDYLLKPISYEDVMNCFQKIREDLDSKAQIQPENQEGYYEGIVKKVQKYLEKNYKEASLEGAAAEVNLSTSYLSRIFKEKAGIGFADLLCRIRMEKAMELLENPDYKSYEIAFHIGYDDPKNFSRAFKSYCQMSPSEYRSLKLRKGDGHDA